MRHENVKSWLLINRGIVVKTWFKNLSGFLPFIGNRKIARRFGVLPSGQVTFAVISIGVVSVFLMHYFADQRYMDWFKVSNTDDPTSVFSKTTDLAQVHWVLVPTGIVILLISFIKSNPKSNYELVTWHHKFMGVYFIFTSVAFSGLLTLLLKNVFGRVRPNFYDGVNLWQSFPFKGQYDFLSFPSGHTTTAGAIAMIIYLFAPRFTLVGVFFAIWISISRLGVGAHYPADVIAGLFVGYIFTWLYARSFARKRLLFRFDGQGKLAFRKPYGSS